jgi:RNA 2',3'-cyclic 3'-phosphodiesterase
MKTLRSFIAIELSEEVRQSVSSTILSYQKLVPAGWVKWVPTKNLHLTIKFLGDTPITLIPSIQEQMDKYFASTPAFQFTAAAAGMFPSARKPRIIWIGLDNKLTLTELSKGLDEVLVPLHIDREAKPFSPHLTIGRVYQGLSEEQLSKLGEIILRNQPGVIGIVTIDHINLIKSDLFPTGPVYSILHYSKLASF